MNKKYSFLESHDEMNKIKSNVSRANILVRDKISTMLDYKFGITIRDKNNNSLNEKKSNIESIEKNPAINSTIPRDIKIDEVDGKQSDIATNNRQIEKKNKYTPSLSVIEESIEDEYTSSPSLMTGGDNKNETILSKIDIDKEFGKSFKLFSAYRLEHNLNELSIKKERFIKAFTEMFFDDFSHLENGTRAKDFIIYFQRQWESPSNLKKLDSVIDKIKSNLSKDDFKTVMRNASNVLTSYSGAEGSKVNITEFITLLVNMSKTFVTANETILIK